MSTRIAPVDVDATDGKTKELLNDARPKFGMVPNGLKTMAQAPAVLEGYLALSNALSKGVLPAATREQLALAVSQTNGCEYCLSAHSLTAKLAGLKGDQITAARQGKANDPKAQALLSLTLNALEHKGKVPDEELAAARAAGLTDTELVEVVGNVAVMVLTNFLNNIANTNVDFPKVSVSA